MYYVINYGVISDGLETTRTVDCTPLSLESGQVGFRVLWSRHLLLLIVLVALTFIVPWVLCLLGPRR